MTDPSLPSPTSISNSRLRQYAWIALAIALVLAVWGIVSRVRARNVLSTETAVAAAPTVATVRPTSAPATESLVLPGSVQAYYEAPIYARTRDRKSTRLNSSHGYISYAVFCLKKKNN